MYGDDKDVILLVLKFRIEWEQFDSEGFSQSSWRAHRIFPLTGSSRRDTLFLEETAVCLQKTFITRPSSTRCSMMAGLFTHDPFTLRHGRKYLYADLGAERLISAEKGLKKIVVEVKSFLGDSDVKDLEQAVGQYVLYRHLLDEVEPERLLYLAVTPGVYTTIFEDGLGEPLLARHLLRLVVFRPQEEVIAEWIPD